MRILPAQCTLTQGQSQEFELEAVGAAATSLAGARWSVSSGRGMIDAAGRYTAPAIIAEVSEATLTASLPGLSATAKVQLVPVEVILFPDKVTLREGESQQFTAAVPGVPVKKPGADGNAAAAPVDASRDVRWTVSPAIGRFDAATGTYTATDCKEDREIEIIATSIIDPRKSSKATVRLLSKPLESHQVAGLFIYLLAVFGLVWALISLWPPAAAPTGLGDRAHADRIAADALVAKLREDEAKAIDAGDKAALDEEQPGSTADHTAPMKFDEAEARIKKELTDAEKAARDAAEDEMNHVDPKLDVSLLSFKWQIPRDVDLLWLVLISGALGSFVYTARSFVDFVGNKTIRGSWTVWYLMYPFIGAALAMIFYLAVRGGFLAATTSSADINLFGLVAISGLVGMFSKQATSKLGEVFTTMFKTDKEDELKDKLDKPPAKKGNGDQNNNTPVQGG